MKRTRTCLAILIALSALTASAAWAGGAKVKVCHIPPGNPANFHTITISENALQAHLGHGDLAGACFAHCDTLCSDGNACTIDACDASERCISTHPPVNCDDGNLCTTDSCNPATGCASVPKTCTDGDNCTVNACDPLTGSCVAPPVACPAGQSCDPANGECQSTDFCEVNPCVNGDCANGATGYTCSCLPGWTGTNCEIDIDDCEPNPCAHGTCEDKVDDYQCHCPPQWTGTNCDIPADACDGVVCPVPDQCHEPATCSGGVCSPHPNKPDGTPCDSGIFGALNERCLNGLCVYEAPY